MREMGGFDTDFLSGWFTCEYIKRIKAMGVEEQVMGAWERGKVSGVTILKFSLSLDGK
jgi:hypothetical protein